MFIKTFIVFLAFLLALSQASLSPSQKTCWGAECSFKINKDAADISQIMGQQIKRAYWYYLRGAELLYQNSVDTKQRILSIYFYLNDIGTFLAMSSWEKQSNEAEIITLIRVANGRRENIRNSNTNDVLVDPFVIQLRLPQPNLVIQSIDLHMDDFKVEGQRIFIPQDFYGQEEQEYNEEYEGEENDEEKYFRELQTKFSKFNSFARQKYWYYLKNSKIIYPQTIITPQKMEILITYVNIIGTFLVMGFYDNDDQMKINTFVRLGSGYDPNDIQPINIEPTLIELN